MATFWVLLPLLIIQAMYQVPQFSATASPYSVANKFFSYNTPSSGAVYVRDLEPGECLDCKSSSTNGYDLLHIKEEEMFHHLSDFPLSESLEQSMECYFIDSMHIFLLLDSINILCMDFHILANK